MATNRAVQAIVITKDQPAITNRAAQAVVISQDPPTAVIRNVRGYALTASPTTTQIRNVRGYALTAATKPPPVAQTGINAMLWLLNQNVNVGTPFTLSQISIGSPSAYNDPTGRTNAKVLVSALAGSGYKGTMTAYYTRRTIDSVFSTTTWLLGTISSATTIRALIPQINTAYGVGLDPTDVVDGPVAAGATSIVLTAASGSYMFQPGSLMSLPQYALSSAAPMTKLAGFDNAAGVGPGPMNTVVLNHFDGGNGSTAFADATSQPIKVNGSLAMSTGTAKFGPSSVLFGNSATLSLQYDKVPSFNNGDWTIEFWIYAASLSSIQGLFMKTVNGYSGAYISTTGTVSLFAEDNSGTVNGPSAITINAWHHLAFVKKNGVYTIYQDGVGGTSGTLKSFSDDTAPFIFGKMLRGGTTYPAYAYLDELRISRVARYSANFTPPAVAFTLD